MNNKSVFKWLTVTLLLGVSIMSYALFARLSPQPSEPRAESPTASENAPSSKSGGNKPSVGEAVSDSPDYYNTFPRIAVDYGDALVQNVGGSKRETLREVHTIGSKHYLVFDSESDSYDVRNKRGKAVCLALLDKDLNLLDCVSVSENAETYLSSKISTKGLFVAAKGDGYTKIYSVDYALNVVGKLTLESFDSAYFYFTEAGVYLFASTDERVTAKLLSPDLEIIHSATYNRAGGRISEIFPSADGFDLLVQNADALTVIRYKPNGGFTDDVVFNGIRAHAAYPSICDGKPSYTMLTSSESEFYLTSFDRNFTLKTKRPIGAADECGLFPVSGGWLVIATSGGATETAVYCNHFDKIFENETDRAITEISSFENVGAALRLSARTADGKLLTLRYENGVLTTESEYSSSGGFSAVSCDGSIFFCSAVKSGIYSENRGNADIFAIKRKSAPDKNRA